MGQSVKDLIRQARRPERTYELCLRGDLQAEWEALDRRLAEITRQGPASLEGDDRVKIARRMEELRTQMEAAQLTLTVRALRPDEFRDLEAQHPPHKEPRKTPKKPADDADDAAVEAYEQAVADHRRAVDLAARDRQAGGVNVDTFYAALIRACVVDPALDDDDWDRLDDVLTDRQFNELAGLALVVNRGEVSVPFSPTASRLTRTPSQS